MYEAIINKLEDTIRELKYPPLSGKPTEADILVTLDMALNFILSDEVDPDEYAEAQDRIEELESAIEDAADKAEEILTDLRLAVESGEIPTCKTVEDMETQLMEIRSDLRRA